MIAEQQALPLAGIESKKGARGILNDTLHEWFRYRDLCKIHDGLTTVSWAARVLNVSRQRAHQLIAAGLLPTVEALGKMWIPCDSLEAFAQMERDSSTRYVRPEPEVA